jgi:hypothetical protein
MYAKAWYEERPPRLEEGTQGKEEKEVTAPVHVEKRNG